MDEVIYYAAGQESITVWYFLVIKWTRGHDWLFFFLLLFGACKWIMTHVAGRMNQTSSRRRRPWKSSSPEARGRSARLLYGRGGEKGMQILKPTSLRVNTSNEGGNISSLLIFQRVRNWQKTVGCFGFLLRGTAARRFSFQERKRNEEKGGGKGTFPPHAVAWSPGGQMYWLHSDVLTFGGMYAESTFALRDALREQRHTGRRGDVYCLLIYFASFFLWSIPNISP